MTATKTATKKFPAVARILSTGERISLSAPSKMPCYSWSIPAGSTCPGAKLSVVHQGDNAVCGSCYAQGGFYLMPSTKTAQMARRAWIARSLAHDDGAEFVSVMIEMIRESVHACGTPRFRGHDSGDFFSVAYIEAWIAICEALPSVTLWFPTRSYIVPNLEPALRRLAALPNVVMRPSAEGFDEEAPMLDGFAAGSTVARSLPVAQTLRGRVCPTATGAKTCAGNGCFHCWDNPTEPTIYIEH